MKLKLAAVMMGVALVFACTTAQAAVIIGQDDDIEFLFSYDPETNTLTPKTTGTIEEGDVLVSIFELPSLSVDGVSQIGDNEEITGIAIVQVADIDGSTVTFQAFEGGFNLLSPVDVEDGDAGEGAVVAIFSNDLSFDLELDPAVNLATNCTSFAQCAAEATAGDLLQVDGFAGDEDEFWIATLIAAGALDVDTVEGLSETTLVAAFNAALTNFENNIPAADTDIAFMNILTGQPCPGGTTGLDGCVAGPTLSGTVLGGAGLNPDLGAFARSDFDARKLTSQVPGPPTLTLMGIGLLAVAATWRRRR